MRRHCHCCCQQQPPQKPHTHPHVCMCVLLVYTAVSPQQNAGALGGPSSHTHSTQQTHNTRCSLADSLAAARHSSTSQPPKCKDMHSSSWPSCKAALRLCLCCCRLKNPTLQNNVHGQKAAQWKSRGRPPNSPTVAAAARRRRRCWPPLLPAAAAGALLLLLLSSDLDALWQHTLQDLVADLLCLLVQALEQTLTLLLHGCST